MYFGVLAVGVIGAIVARLQSSGMARALFATALAQALVPVIALIVWPPQIARWGAAGVVGVFLLNVFFVLLFVRIRIAVSESRAEAGSGTIRNQNTAESPRRLDSSGKPVFSIAQAAGV